MRANWILLVRFAGAAGPSHRGQIDDLPPIRAGVFAAWASRRSAPIARRAGEPCMTDDGRPGRVTEVIEDGRVTLECIVA